MGVPIMICNFEDIDGDDYSWLDNDEAKSYLRELFNRGDDQRTDYNVLCSSINDIYLSILRIREEMTNSYNVLLTCVDLLKKYVNTNCANSEDGSTLDSSTSSTFRGNQLDDVSDGLNDSLGEDHQYSFPLASCVKCSCLIKIVVNHAVAGLYIGKNGAHLKRLQSKYQFKLTQSGRGAKGDFTGVGYPCHRTNTTLLFQGNLVDILHGLRPLYKIIQSDILALDDKSLEFLSGRTVKVKFELNLVVPADRKRILLQDTGRRCMQLRNASGVEIIAGKQNFEVGNIKESIVTLFGFEENVERAMEWLGIFLQESPAITSGDYYFMDYPKYTTAIPETNRT
ncbi:hypothetical protein TpMuguga_01g00851 [Theileria parva strain Muguga]|nr:uncharacterized protein TpMuguga_01g00851 [Theileria parva strain Muguga]EAN34089.2 hypothetical protein TpMuguga_01g00851 [Theileria parva strain Muguga]